MDIHRVGQDTVVSSAVTDNSRLAGKARPAGFRCGVGLLVFHTLLEESVADKCRPQGRDQRQSGQCPTRLVPPAPSEAPATSRRISPDRREAPNFRLCR